MVLERSEELRLIRNDENKRKGCSYSEEYFKLYNELDRKIAIIDNLEKQIGCPLEVFVELHNKAHIYDVEGKPLKVLTVLADTVVVKAIQGKREFILLEDYKKSFWLRKNKSR